MKKENKTTPKPKKIADMQLSGTMTKERVSQMLETDINTCLQMLYVIRESKELKSAMADVLMEKFFTKQGEAHKE